MVLWDKVMPQSRTNTMSLGREEIEAARCDNRFVIFLVLQIAANQFSTRLMDKRSSIDDKTTGFLKRAL